MTDQDKTLLRILQDGIPVCEKPYVKIAEETGISESEVLEKITAWQRNGLIRKFGAFINHRISGFTANGMAVFEIPRDKVEEIGNRLTLRKRISHCYERPRLPYWPYRLYAMIHGRSKAEVEAEVSDIIKKEGISEYRLLFSTKEFKKTGSRLFMENNK